MVVEHYKDFGWKFWFLFVFFEATMLFNHSIIYYWAFAMIFVASIASIIVNKIKRFSPLFFVYYALFILFAYIQIHYIGVFNKEDSAFMLVAITQNIFVYLCLFLVIYYFKCVDTALRAYILASLTQVVIMIVFSQLLGFSGRLGEDIDLQIFGLTFTYNSNSIAFTACLSLSFLILDRSLYSGIWVWIFGAILFFALLISGSKKTLFLIICAFIWYGFLGGKSKKIKLTSFVRGAVITSVVILGVYVIVMTVPFFYDIIGIRIEEMFDYYNGGYGDSSTRSRDELMQIGMDNFYDHPLWGVGINNFRSFNNSFYYSHNDYVELLSGVGLIGCIIAYLPKLYILIRVLLELRREYANYIFITSEFFILAYGTVSYYKREDWLVLVIILALLEINKNKKIKHQRANKYCQ